LPLDLLGSPPQLAQYCMYQGHQDSIDNLCFCGPARQQSMPSLSARDN
jgi:hypothetical protein